METRKDLSSRLLFLLSFVICKKTYVFCKWIHAKPSNFAGVINNHFINHFTITTMAEEKKYRVESDLLGELKVPAEAYYGVQTQRALNNYHISRKKMRDYPD